MKPSELAREHPRWEDAKDRFDLDKYLAARQATWDKLDYARHAAARCVEMSYTRHTPQGKVVSYYRLSYNALEHNVGGWRFVFATTIRAMRKRTVRHSTQLPKT